MAELSDLKWFPVYIADWLSSSAVSSMLPEQEGAFFRLLLIAWGNGDKEPSLPIDDESLARTSRLGRRWAKLGAVVRSQFIERDGRLYNVKLSAVWEEQQAKHAAAVKKARHAANARHGKSSSEHAPSKHQAVHKHANKKLEGEEPVQTLSESVPGSAPDGALAQEAPRLPAVPPPEWCAIKDTIFADLKPEERIAARAAAAEEAARIARNTSQRLVS